MPKDRSLIFQISDWGTIPSRYKVESADTDKMNKLRQVVPISHILDCFEKNECDITSLEFIPKAHYHYHLKINTSETYIEALRLAAVCSCSTGVDFITKRGICTFAPSGSDIEECFSNA